MAENREYFISCLQLLKSELSDENYKKITGVMKALKYGLDFDYKPGYDIDFEYDIDTIKEKKRINNVVKFKLVSKK
jgi:hypothetical protein